MVIRHDTVTWFMNTNWTERWMPEWQDSRRSLTPDFLQNALHSTGFLWDQDSEQCSWTNKSYWYDMRLLGCTDVPVTVSLRKPTTSFDTTRNRLQSIPNIHILPPQPPPWWYFCKNTENTTTKLPKPVGLKGSSIFIKKNREYLSHPGCN